MKLNWLSRRISAPGPYMCLCLSENEYHAAIKHLRITRSNPWINSPQAHATTHIMECNNELTVIVCLNDYVERDPIEVAGLLIHEAVHVWQGWRDFYGEHRPAVEQEAYAIQASSQDLMAEFCRRIKEKNRG